MRRKSSIAVDIISRIDEDIVEKNLIKRFELWFSRGKKPKRNKWIPIIASAASFLLVATMVFLLWPKTPIDNPPVDERQAPVYLGMTVSNDAPIIEAAIADAHELTPIALGADRSMLRPMYLDNTNYEGNNGNHGNKDNKDNSTTPPEISGGPYYAMPGEDIYIHVHISNPDEFEILSFTLNEFKYSAYMFEDGSDLETLILKCNVGNVEGVMQYTIDAIKYIDGEEIKDVKMDGDRTIEVMVGQGVDAALGFEISLDGFDVNIEEIWEDSFEGDKEILSLGVYDGETLIKELSPTDRVIKGLPTNSRFVLVATYKNGDRTETARHIFDTRKLSEGFQMSSGHITGIGTCQDTVLYIDAPIGENAFAGNKYITEVHFGPNVTLIDNGAFSGCVGLTEVNFGPGVTSIGESAFADCVGLTEMLIPDGVTSIGNSAFEGCTGLTNVSLLNGITSIGDSVFKGCTGLTSVSIPDGVTSIGNSAFEGCISLASISIPDGVTSIGKRAFASCVALTEVVIPDTVSQMSPAFDECYIEKATIPVSAISGMPGTLETVVISSGNKIQENAFSNFRRLKTLVIPASITSIAEGALIMDEVVLEEGNTAYTLVDDCIIEISTNKLIWGGENSVIPNYVTAIGGNAFYGRNLTNITIPRGVTTIGGGAFYGCKALKEITIPNTVKILKGMTFYNCIGLENITIEEGTSFTEVGEYEFGFDSYYDVNIKKITSPLSVFGCFKSMMNIDDPTVAVDSIETVVLTDTDTQYRAPMFSLVVCIKNLEIGEGITRLTRETFDSCSFESVTIPKSVTQIDARAFYDVGIGTLKYAGTKAQWKAINKADDWVTRNSYMPDYVQCTDGMVAIG